MQVAKQKHAAAFETVSCLSKSLVASWRYFSCKCPPEVQWTPGYGHSLSFYVFLVLLGQLDSLCLSNTLTIGKSLDVPFLCVEITGLRLLLLSAATLKISYGTFLHLPGGLGELDKRGFDCSKDTETCKLLIQVWKALRFLGWETKGWGVTVAVVVRTEPLGRQGACFTVPKVSAWGDEHLCPAEFKMKWTAMWQPPTMS